TAVKVPLKLRRLFSARRFLDERVDRLVEDLLSRGSRVFVANHPVVIEDIKGGPASNPASFQDKHRGRWPGPWPTRDWRSRTWRCCPRPPHPTPVRCFGSTSGGCPPTANQPLRSRGCWRSRPR